MKSYNKEDNEKSKLYKKEYYNNNKDKHNVLLSKNNLTGI